MSFDAPGTDVRAASATPSDDGRNLAVHTTALAATAKELPEYNMIEMNGNITATWKGMSPGEQGKVAISHEDGADPRYFDGVTLGEFSIGVGNRPQIVIGSHRLLGDIKPINPPVRVRNNASLTCEAGRCSAIRARADVRWLPAHNNEAVAADTVQRGRRSGECCRNIVHNRSA